MDSDLYDEFGNYIGPDLESESEEEEYEPENDVSCCCTKVWLEINEKYFRVLG